MNSKDLNENCDILQYNQIINATCYYITNFYSASWLYCPSEERKFLTSLRYRRLENETDEPIENVLLQQELDIFKRKKKRNLIMIMSKYTQSLSMTTSMSTGNKEFSLGFYTTPWARMLSWFGNHFQVVNSFWILTLYLRFHTEMLKCRIVDKFFRFRFCYRQRCCTDIRWRTGLSYCCAGYYCRLSQ